MPSTNNQTTQSEPSSQNNQIKYSAQPSQSKPSNNDGGYLGSTELEMVFGAIESAKTGKKIILG